MSIGRAPPRSGSEPTSHMAAASRLWTRRIRVNTSCRSTIRRDISLPMASFPELHRETWTGSASSSRAVFWKGGASKCGDEISLFEVLTLEKERLTGNLGERIGEAVAEVK